MLGCVPAVQATTWRLLTDACVSVSRYLAPHSGHGIDAEMAEHVTLAWNDMFSGIQRRTPGADCVN